MRWQAPDWVIYWGPYKVVIRVGPEGASMAYYHVDTQATPGPEVRDYLRTIAEQAVNAAMWAVRNSS